MSYRPDAPAFSAPALSTDAPIVTLSTDDAPEVDADGGTLEVGATWLHDDTGQRFYWTGDEWKAITVEQANALSLDLQFEIRDLLQTMLSDAE